MNTKLRQKITTLAILLIVFAIPISFSIFNLNSGVSTISNGSLTDRELVGDETNEFGNFEPKSSDVYHIGDKYDLSIWWNKTYRYRIGFVLEETEGIDRYQPIDVYFTFRDNEHYENTERLISFNATGNDEWSDPIPMQMWNTTEVGGYITACTITFIANVSANSNKTYFLYYNENNEGIEQISYNTNFSSDYSSGTLTVTVGTEYKAVLKTGLASTQLVRQGIDFHMDDALSPEKELSDPRLKFLAHFENSYSDSTDNEPDGTPTGGPSFSNGKVRSGIEFDGTNFVSYANGLQDAEDPFDDGSTEFTLTAWVKPDVLTNARSNHYTQNVFAAKASDPYNDNFEIGINSGSLSGQAQGTVHVYIDCTGSGADTYANFGNTGDVVVGEWNFIAVRFNADTGACDVRINDVWYYNTWTWSGAVDLDQAEGSPFTIGATEHINTYFDGVIDEVAVYNEYLNKDDIEDYKLGSMPSTIQSISTIDELENGEVFSRYKIDWNPAFDMYTSDICTFYYDYNLWSIKRSIYFENEFNYTTDSMFALNTNYNFTGVSDHSELLYVFDGNLQKDITSAGFVAENYTVIHNAPDTSKDAIGMFIADFEVSDPAHMSISYLRGDILYDSGVVQFLPGSNNDLDNSVGNSSYKLNIDFWELAGSVNTSGSLDNTGVINYFDSMLLTLREETNVYIYEQ
ncbi:MAG: LamG domain-containing protein, partial [Promethearchaeota archaeon]